jgi:Tol biopolymer transport system component
VLPLFAAAMLGLAAVLVRAAGPPTERISVASNGQQGYGWSGEPAFSEDGRFVAFSSAAPNLVPNDTNGFGDIFVKDRQTGVVERVSVSSSGAQADSWSASPGISSDGRYVVFASEATNLTSLPAGGRPLAYVHDRETGVTECVSVNDNGQPANGYALYPTISGDGNVVAFESDAYNLAPYDPFVVATIYLRNRSAGTTVRRGQNLEGPAYLNEDGSVVVESSDGLSADGQIAVYAPAGGGNVTVRNLATNSSVQIVRAADGGAPNGLSGPAALSRDGRFVAFVSAASNLVPGDTNGVPDVFVYDRNTGYTRLASLTWANKQANDASATPALNGDGSLVAFASAADNLVPGDWAGQNDVFVRQVGVYPLPPSLRLQTVTANQVRLMWGPTSDGATGYRVERKVGNSWTLLGTVGPDVRNFIDTQPPNAGGTFRVRALGISLNAGYSNELTVKPLPTAPVNLHVTAITSRSLSLAWQDSGEELANQLNVFNYSTGQWTAVALPAGTNHYLLDYQTSNSRFAFYVRSVNESGAGDASAKITAWTLAKRAVPIVKALSPTQLRVTWQSASPGAVSYTLERLTGANQWQQVYAVANATTPQVYEVGGLQPSTDYTFRVHTYNPSGEAQDSPAEGTGSTAMEAPTNLAARTLSSSQIRLTWNDVSPNETGFEIYRQNGNLPYTKIATVGANTTQYVDNGLAANTRYVYYLRAINREGASAITPKVSATTLSDP